MSQQTENTAKKRVIIPLPTLTISDLKFIADAEDRTVPQQILRYVKTGLKHDRVKYQLDKAS